VIIDVLADRPACAKECRVRADGGGDEERIGYFSGLIEVNLDLKSMYSWKAADGMARPVGLMARQQGRGVPKRGEGGDSGAAGR